MKLQSLRFGVEVETTGRTRGTVAEAIRSVTGGTARHVGYPQAYDPWEVTAPDGRIWKVVSDASLTSVAEHLRAEVVTPILTYDDLTKLQEVVRAVKAIGASADPACCSVHVHCDGSAFDGRALGNLAKLVYKQEPLLIKALGIQQRRLDRYTKPISAELIARIERFRPRTLEEMNRAWYGYHNRNPQRYDSSRYCLLNLASLFFRGSIEIRAFEATLEAEKIQAYVQMVLALAARALNSRAASSRKRTFDPASARYDLRCFLLKLEMSGDEFKTARKHLLATMPGDSAFKRGRPKGPKQSPGKEGVAAEWVAPESAGEAPESASTEAPEPAPPPIEIPPSSTSCPEVPTCAA
jgi:hypothetical protein